MAGRHEDGVLAAEGAANRAAAPRDGAAAWPGWMWARNPELWGALALGAFLRLWSLDVTPIGYDQVLQVQLARQALERGALPIAGLQASVGLMGSPLGIYLTMPFAAFGPSPLPVAASIALFNLLGVAACYIFTLRCFGRQTAAIATLLFATCGAAVDSSRVIWLPNYVPAVLAFWALTLEAGVRRRRHGWLLPCLPLFTAATLLHPAALLLLPAMVVAILLAPPRRRELALAAAAALLLLLPNVLWEALSRGADLRALGQYAAGRSSVNLEVLFRIYQLFGGPQSALQPEHVGTGLRWLLDLVFLTPTRTLFVSGAPYNALAPLYFPLALLATALFGVGWAVLTVRIFGPLARLWRSSLAAAAASDSRPRRHGMLARVTAVWQTAGVDPLWRMRLLLWVCVTVPPLLTLRHNGPIQPHYLLCLYPFCFIVAGMGGSWLFEIVGRVRLLRARLAGPRLPSVGALAVAVALALLLVGQAAQSVLATLSFSAGAFDLGPHPASYTLAELQSAESTLERFVREQGARRAVVLTTLTTHSALTYFLAGERAERVAVDQSCLVVPRVADQPALIVSSDPRHAAAQLLAILPNARRVADVPLSGSDPLTVYRVQGLVPPLADEQPVAQVAFGDGLSSDGLRLDAVALAGPNQLRLRWTALGTTAPGATPMGQRVTATLRRPDGEMRASTWMECNPTSWHAGDTVFTWEGYASLPGGETMSALLRTAPGDSLQIGVERFSTPVDLRTLGSLSLISGWPVPPQHTALPAQAVSGGDSGGGTAVQLSATSVTLTAANFAVVLAPSVHLRPYLPQVIV